MLPKRYIATEHDIDPAKIDADALYVLGKLHQAGYEAYLVGGSVRDLLVKRNPKDFDVSTSARPEEIKKLFGRRCILIGRRFRLAHIRFGRKVIEVSTFRSGDNEDDLIIRDNQWGSAEEDVTRRDFTINGLFYDPMKHEVIDYVGGWEDIHQNLIRSIGDPNVRFRQDPVRMIRLLKFRARFGFEIDPVAKTALINCREEIVKSAPARILEELLRMLESGASAQFFHLMKSSKLLYLILPKLSEFLDQEEGKKVYELLNIADRLNQTHNTIALERSVLASCLLFPILETRVQQAKELLNIGEIIQVTAQMMHEIVSTSFSHFPKRLTHVIQYVLASQYRLTPIGEKTHFRTRIFSNKEFGLALDLLKIRALHNKELFDIYTHWRNLYHQNLQEQRRDHHKTSPPPKRRRRRGGKPS